MHKKLPKLVNISLWLIILVIVLVPFQGFITTWPASKFGHLLIFRAWKEVILAFVGIILLIQAYKDPAMLKKVLSFRVNQLILAFMGLSILLGLIFRPNFSALTQGLILDLRFFAIFVFAQVLVFYGWRPNWQFLAKIILIPATIVVALGFLQAFVLPHNFLSHFGYSKATIPPFLTVYQGSSVIRINSFLRGPNPLGAYLILPFSIFVTWFIKKRESFKWWYGLWFVPAVVTMYFSQSRSAWLGLVLALVVLLWLGLPKTWRPNIIKLSVASLVVLVVGWFALRHTYLVQNSILHTSSDRKTNQTSNEGHIDSLEKGWKDVLKHPLGEAPGSAGPASVRDPNNADITENYYLQIAQETGWLGFGLFVAILAQVFMLLYKNRQTMWSLVLLASLAGITLANIFLPVWTDDTLSLVWWALAGVVIALYLSSGSKTWQSRPQG